MPHLKLVRAQLAETEATLARERARAAHAASRHDGLSASAHSLVDPLLFPEVAAALQPRRAPAPAPSPGAAPRSDGAPTPQTTPWGTPARPLWEEGAAGAEEPPPMPLPLPLMQPAPPPSPGGAAWARRDSSSAPTSLAGYQSARGELAAAAAAQRHHFQAQQAQRYRRA